MFDDRVNDPGNCEIKFEQQNPSVQLFDSIKYTTEITGL